MVVPARINRLPWHAPLLWLRLGWRDLWRAPRVSLAYGAAFAFLGYLLVAGMQAANLTPLWPGLASLSLLLFPAMAGGLYHVSQRLEWGRVPDFDEATAAWLANRDQLLFLGLMLLFAVFGWLLLQLWLMAVLLGTQWPALDELTASRDGLEFIAASALLSAGMGLVGFAGLAVSLPLAMHREIDFVRAIAVSLAAARRNPAAASFWAVTAGLLLSFGFASFTIGLVIAGPLLGHATWHAYRALVEPVGLAVASG